MLTGKTKGEVTVESVQEEIAALDSDYQSRRKVALDKLRVAHTKARLPLVRLLSVLIEEREREEMTRHDLA